MWRLQFLLVGDPLALERKKHHIDGDRIFAMVQDATTKAVQDMRFELHHNYTDIQVLLEGRERHGYAPPPSVNDQPLEDRLVENDVAFYAAPEAANILILRPGQYAVYLPFELHAPSYAVDVPEKIVKVILKIHKSCLY
jgi:YhcH/YjgK/YiaL family protein